MAKQRINWTLTGSAPAGVRRLGRDDFAVVFQPIVELSSGRAIAHEALVRCKNVEYPTPVDLFEAAAKEEACGRLGRTIREVAFETCGDIALFVNLHSQELSSRWLVQPDDPIGFHGKPVYLEITESATLTHFEVCRDVLKDLCKRTGARLVVDDFGAGYSNLERVVELGPEVVKLDLALTRGIHKRKAKQIVMRHITNMCKELGASVIAEGVEEIDELLCVRDLGVDCAQGYLLARPSSPPPTHSWPAAMQRATAPVVRKGPPPLPARKTPSAAPPKRASKGPGARSSKSPPGKAAASPAVSKTASTKPPRR